MDKITQVPRLQYPFIRLFHILISWSNALIKGQFPLFLWCNASYLRLQREILYASICFCKRKVCMLLIYVYVTVVVPLCRSRHGSFIIALVDLSGSARLSVHWPQNCFYKCKSRCFIALQPNRITRLFSYSREVEQRLRAAQMKTYGHFCVCVSFFLFLPCSFLSLPLPLSYIIFPHLSYLSRLSQDPCPSSLPSPPFNKYTSVAWASANVGCLATEFSEPHLRRASFFLVGLLKAISKLASPARWCGLPECQWGFSTNIWLSWA